MPKLTGTSTITLTDGWFLCPLCHQIGYASMFGDGCTVCSNKRLFNEDGTHKIPHPTWEPENIKLWKEGKIK